MRSLNPFLLQMLMTGSGILLANISALTVHRLMESPPQLDPSPQSVWTVDEEGGISEQENTSN